jgi:TonB-dependent starch-binding outer membrane protein SusC
MRKTIARLSATALALLCFFLTTFAQNTPVTGTVTDQNGAGIPGVTVTVQGTNVATQTDAQGRYSINAPSNGTLVLSSVGYGTSEVRINGQTTLTTQLSTQGTNLNEVVVVGYGTARRRDITGSVSTVREKDFNKGVFTAPDQLIQGKAAGVLVINNTGQPGGSTTVRIRGTSSIRSGNQPLFVVDGVPLSGGSARPGGNGASFGNDPGNPLNFINPNDIASIEILKDASATAIYGSRGANGVVIVTTKRGKTGTPQIDMSASVSASNVLKKLEVLNGDEYRQALKDYNQTSGDYGGNVDAFDAISRTGFTQNYNTAISGGTENGRYRISLGYLDQQGIIKNSDLKKYTASLTSQFRFLESKKLGLDVNILTGQTDENIAPISAFVGFEGNLISQALQWNPTLPLKGRNSATGQDTLTVYPVGSTTINPLAQLDYYQDKARVNTIIASISPSYRITKDLEYRFLYSANRQSGVRRGQVNRLLNLQGIQNRGSAFVGEQEKTDQQFTNTLNYNKQVTSSLNLNAVVGHEYLKFDRRETFIAGQDFPNVGLNYYDILNVSTISSRIAGSFANPTTELQSYFARAIVNYQDKYLITGTFRADGSTRFGKNNKYGYFPSIAAAWNITNEGFLKGNSFISNLKLRAGWGTTGNQEFPSGASLNRIALNNNGEGVRRVNFGNEDLKWETSKTTNVGVDFSILNNRLNGSVDYFYKKTTDVLFERTLAAPADPNGKIWVNLDGYVLNKGVEVTLNANILNSRDMNWNFGGNISFLDNTVNGLAGFYETGALRGQGFSDVRAQRIINGQPINVWYIRRFEGLDKTTGQSIYSDGGNTLYYSGSPNPKTLLGVSTDFSYKKLTATLNLNGTFGHYVFNNTAASVLGIGNLGNRNVAKSVFDTDVKEAISNAPAPSTRNLEKGNYLKMSNATIAYRIGNLGSQIKNVNISLTGQNLFVITNYTGFDPEVNTDAGENGIPSLGVEYIPYPSARTILLGINFSL